MALALLAGAAAFADFSLGYCTWLNATSKKSGLMGIGSIMGG